MQLNLTISHLLGIHKSFVERGRRVAQKVFQLEDKYAKISDQEILEEVGRLKKDFVAGSISDSCIIKGFALAREAAMRTFGFRHYEVQLIAGYALLHGACAEMATGEGKTLTATLPTFLWSLYGKGVHVVTTNSYLAQRDCELMTPLFKKLGVSVGLTSPSLEIEQKRKAYQCDITYGVGPEFGFDYLRDQIASLEQAKQKLGSKFLRALKNKKIEQPKIQRGHAYALIDEADSVLVDEASSPLVISGPQVKSRGQYIYLEAKKVADSLKKDEDFTVESSTKKIELTDQGYEKISQNHSLKKGEKLKSPWSSYILQSLNAHYFFHKDVHYVIEDSKVVIVDEFTGRKFAERSWRDGLHQAVEAKEGLEVSDPSSSLARITRQRYFNLYENIAGMTGTTQGIEKEVLSLYQTQVAYVPLRKKTQRKVLADTIFADLESKWQAIVEKVMIVHKTKQPILIGTRTIKDSEQLAFRLQKCGLRPQVLNAKQDKLEAKIISQAGKKGAITIATNMAGRGTDISVDEEVEKLGGLFVIGTERHESRRVDNQLIGRCARKGQPGIAQFFLSLEDELVTRHAPKIHNKMKEKNGLLPGRYERVFRHIQDRLDRVYFQKRREMYRYDNWLEELLNMVG